MLFVFFCMMPVGVFFGLVIAETINKTGWRYWIVFILTSLLFTGLIAGAFTLEETSDENRWNNGICSVDDTELHFVNATTTRSAGSANTKYYYECADGHIYEFKYLHENVKK